MRLRSRLFALISEKHLHFTNAIEDFRRALVKYRTIRPIVVAYVVSLADVAEIKTLNGILDDLFLIIITGNDDQEVVVNCRRLYPRLLSHSDEDLKIVTAVVEKRLAGFG
jgi:galactokinase